MLTTFLLGCILELLSQNHTCICSHCQEMYIDGAASLADFDYVFPIEKKKHHANLMMKAPYFASDLD